MLNKRGQGLSTNTLILLILGVIILVVLILGFALGWNPLKKLISPSNVDSIKEDCQTTCGLGQEYSFCSAERTLRSNEDNLEVKTSCIVMASISAFDKYNIPECPSIKCNLACGDIIINSKTGVKNLESGKYDVSILANDLEEGQKCIINS